MAAIYLELVNNALVQVYAREDSNEVASRCQRNIYRCVLSMCDTIQGCRVVEQVSGRGVSGRYLGGKSNPVAIWVPFCRDGLLRPDATTTMLGGL